MFFILGVSQSQKKLDYKELNICKCCGMYSNIEVYMTYWYFMFFFIPLIKWNKEYYVKTDCCNIVAKIDHEIGKSIEKGQAISINTEELDFRCDEYSIKVCSVCGYKTEKDFTYCPKCSNKL
ncbi:zinc ribbon domain-containing protein [Clostridioides mangenotii]|uniref:zinc ribbon domain-containing protein n=1 Tax=Metaclostridioides mangenotii TaxID=1540 RepID=UPI002149DD66|nr:zinc ribbon domain-containing protein [Clostridioides mangenotii]MCR1955810.1 zinc ribbon domain-containing protein [Clostridioides mangenotii]